MLKIFRYYLLAICFWGFPRGLAAQTDIHIAGAKSGFPVAVPQLCDAGEAAEGSREVPEIIGNNLKISGFFKVLNPASYVQTAGKCVEPDKMAFSDWSVIGADGLVHGRAWSTSGGKIAIELVLYDVLQQKAVLGKRYEAGTSDLRRIANRFSNEVIGFYTGERGIFGSRIAFVGKRGRFKELFVMELDGSGEKQLTRDKGLVVGPSWSRAGDRIAYTSYKTKKPQLYVISSAGGSAKQLTSSDGLKLGPEFSPDGQFILASASNHGDSNLVMYNLAGKIVRKVTNSRAIDVSPSWSPDGSEIAFCSNRAGGPQIYIMAANGRDSRRLTHTGSNYCTSPAWSPKGDRIAFVCRQRGNQIFISSPSGRDTMQLTFRGNNEDPSWSPDGRYIVFSSDFGAGRVKNLGIASLLTGSVRQITFRKSDTGQASWSPRLE